MLATYLVYEGSTAVEAISKIRELRPGSIETTEQEEAIKAYYEYFAGAVRGPASKRVWVAHRDSWSHPNQGGLGQGAS